MSCTKKYCVVGMEKCCTDCMRGEMGYCEQVCKKSSDAKNCINYREEEATAERKERRKKNKQIQTLVMVLLLIAVFLLPALALYQTYQINQEVKALKKELPAATGQLRDPVSTGQNSITV